jgi:predicted acetyltransferase
MRVGAAAVILGGIADVATHPDFRGRGYSTACLQDAIRFMEGNDYDLSMLFTGIQPFYNRLGWETFPTYDITLTLNASPSSEPPDIPADFRIERFAADRHLEQVALVYDKYNADEIGPISRSVEYYSGTLWRYHDPEAFIVVSQGDQVVAYLRGSYGETSDIYEYGSLEPSALDPGLEAAFHHFLQQAHSRGAVRLNYVPSWNDIEFWYTFRPWTQRVVNERTGMMLRIIDLKRFLQRILPVLEERISWRAKSMPIHIGFRVGGSSVGVRWNGTEAEITDGEGAEDVLAGTPIFLLGLMLGRSIFPNKPRSAEMEWAGLHAVEAIGEFTWWPVDNF